jgi:hypothetical protein
MMGSETERGRSSRCTGFMIKGKRIHAGVKNRAITGGTNHPNRAVIR